MLAAKRITQRFYEYVTWDEDGQASSSEDESDFNVDATPHYEEVEELTFDTPAELIEAMRRDGVEFSATGRADTATDPDGSQIIDYRTAEREVISWHFYPTFPMGTMMLVIAFVDARFKRFDYYPSGRVRRVITALPQRHMLRDAIERAEAKRA